MSVLFLTLFFVPEHSVYKKTREEYCVVKRRKAVGQNSNAAPRVGGHELKRVVDFSQLSPEP